MRYQILEKMPLLEAISRLYPDSSKRTLRNWLKKGRFSLDGKPCKHPLAPALPGQVLVSQEHFTPPKVPGLPILFEDDYYIAIDKPEGILSVPLDEEEHSPEHALGLLRKHLPNPQILPVHRLDREASGVLLFAKGKKAQEEMKDLFFHHDLERKYLAVVQGSIPSERGEWNYPLLELPSYHVIESPEGRSALSHFSVLRRSRKYTYLELRLETGRKHQLRVHCQRAGFPILGDRRYGPSDDPIGRLCLHACLLSFKHPFTGKISTIRSPAPPPFKKLGA